MDKYAGEWIVYDYITNIPTKEEIYKLEIIIVESEFKTIIRTTKFDKNFENKTESTINSTIFNNLSEELFFSSSAEDLSKSNSVIEFKSDKLFKGTIFEPESNFTETLNILVGIKLNKNSIENIEKINKKYFGIWKLFTRNDQETNLCSSNIDLKFDDSKFSLNIPFGKNRIIGKYFNFKCESGTPYERTVMNENFGGENEYFIEGIFYDDSIAFIVKFGNYNVCGFDLVYDKDKFQAKWFNISEDGTAIGVRLQ